MGDRQAKINTNRRGLSSNIVNQLSIVLVFFISALPVLAAVEFSTNATYNQEVWQLNQQISDKRKQAEELRKQAEVYSKSLASKRREIASLNYQISTINQTITKISLEKEALEIEIEELELQIKNSNLKIQATEEQMALQKDQLAELIRTLYHNDKQNNLLVILATHSTFSEYLTQVQSLQSLQDTVLGGIESLGDLKIALVQEQEQLDENKKSLETVSVELANKSEALEGQREVKFTLIDETRGQENKYQQLLEELKSEQNRINNDIVSLEQVAREKLNRQLKAGQKDLGSGPMIWPVPGREITAYFHDPDYPYRNVFEHPAIDVRSAQGSPIYASASGYVARAKDAGMGYSYIMILHDNGITTVYGHVSAINVAEGSFVTQGQIIGKSGGKPGTPGAGRLTTGPHLHFEVRLNGIPVNPLNYLPK